MDERQHHTRNLSDPDEQLDLGKGSASTVRLGELVVGRVVLEPGWRWSDHVRPVAGTTSCQFHHVGFVRSFYGFSGPGCAGPDGAAGTVFSLTGAAGDGAGAGCVVVCCTLSSSDGARVCASR